MAYAIYVPTALAAVLYLAVRAYDVLDVVWLQAYLLAINAVAFAFFAWDKIFVSLLKLLHLRVSERVLVWELVFPGGTLGGLAAMLLFRHKTGPDSHDFRMELLKAVLLQIILLVFAYWLGFIPSPKLDISRIGGGG